MSNYERNANRLTIFLFACLVLLSVAGAIWLPNPVAIHYNLSGKPDRWGSPTTLLIIPGLVFFLLGLLWATEKIHPDLMNFPGPRTPENVARQLHNIRQMSASVRVFFTVMFLLIQGQLVWAKLYNHNQLVGWTIPFLIVAPLLLVGFFIRRAYKLVPRQ